jgi:hypothetical protein
LGAIFGGWTLFIGWTPFDFTDGRHLPIFGILVLENEVTNATMFFNDFKNR